MDAPFYDCSGIDAVDGQCLMAPYVYTLIFGIIYSKYNYHVHSTAVIFVI